MADHLRVLIVEDSVDDTFFVVRELQRGGFQVDFGRVETAAAMREAIEAEQWDLIISDFMMPQFDGANALALSKQMALEIPFILVSGAMGEDVAVEMVKAGAHDYIKKNNLSRLVPAVRRELEAAQQRRTRRQTEAATAYLASLVQSCEDAIIGASLQGNVVSWNSGAERLYGYTAVEMMGRSLAILFPAEKPEQFQQILAELAGGGHFEDLQTERVAKDGSRAEVSLTISPVRDPERHIIGFSAIARHISRSKGGTERQRELARAQASPES